MNTYYVVNITSIYQGNVTVILLSSLAFSPRTFWNFMRNNRSLPAIPENVKFETKVSYDINESINLFSKLFSSVYALQTVSSSIKYLSLISFHLPNFKLSIFLLMMFSVQCGLIRFRNNKSIGPDGIPANYLCNLREVLSFPLYLLFQKSLSENVSPPILKLGSITPILKTDDPTNVFNYRPITVLCHITILI